MRPDVARDLSASKLDFLRVVAPVLNGGLCPDGEFEFAEGVDHRFARWTDQVGGIDVIHRDNHGDGIRTFASRLQWVEDRAFRTFTVRSKRPTGSATERDKRIQAIAKGWMCPEWTLQAYVQKPAGVGHLIAVAAVRTRDLYECVELHPSGLVNAARNGGEEFEIYGWDYLKRWYEVWEWSRAEPIRMTSQPIQWMRGA